MTVIPIWWQYLYALSFVIAMVLIAGIVILLLFPSNKIKIATIWVALGLVQTTLWGFYIYPYAVFNFFPRDAAWGLFLLTCGVILYSVSKAQTSIAKQILTIISFISLSCLELAAFIWFYLTFPNISQWNTMIDATSYISFLIASVSTLSCVILIFFRTRRQLTLRSKTTS